MEVNPSGAQHSFRCGSSLHAAHHRVLGAGGSLTMVDRESEARDDGYCRRLPGPANGDALFGAATINGSPANRKPRRGSYTTMFSMGLCEEAYFINVAFMAMFVLS